MSALGTKAAKAQSDIAEVEKALSRTQQALQAVENVDAAATNAAHAAKKRGRGALKLVLILGVLGVAVIVAKKLLAGGGAQANSYEVAPGAGDLDLTDSARTASAN